MLQYNSNQYAHTAHIFTVFGSFSFFYYSPIYLQNTPLWIESQLQKVCPITDFMKQQCVSELHLLNVIYVITSTSTQTRYDYDHKIKL